MQSMKKILGTLSSTFFIGLTNRITLTGSSTALAINKLLSAHVFQIASVQALTPSANAISWNWAGSQTTTRGTASADLSTATGNVTITITNASIGQHYQLVLRNGATPRDVTLTPPSGFTFLYGNGGKPTNLTSMTANSRDLLTFHVVSSSEIFVAVLKDFKA